MNIYGHPWSVNTRKTVMTLAEKGHEANFKPVMIPKGEHKLPEHIALHPFGKVPVPEDDDFVLYETRAINAYLDRKLPGPSLTPSANRDLARFDQIRIECFFPADKETERLARQLVQQQPS